MIDSRFTTPIYVQHATDAWGGAQTWDDRPGHNMGYLRVLSQRERANSEQAKLFSTHRIVMSCSVIPVYGERLRIGTAFYLVKGVDQHELSGGVFQTVDCEVIL